MKLDEEKKKKLKLVIIILLTVIILWLIVLSPILKFKRNEKQVKEAAQRYYEINKSELPTGNNLKTLSLQTLYEKKFISTDLRSSYRNKACDSKSSWVKIKKENNEYHYYVYLKCGIMSSKVDHDGPEIKLNGEDEIIIHKGDKFKDPGIAKVVDNTDGKIDVKEVEVDTKNLNTEEAGTYEITYKVQDSFHNETKKIRTIKVIETLNHIVEKNTGKEKKYKGTQTNNYVKLDGILFRIVGENEDGTVKVVTDGAVGALDYNKKDEWLNEYFYNKLSDSTKELIVKSKWCDEEVTNFNNYSKCDNYSKKRYIGLLSIADVNNSKDSSGSYAIDNNTWLANTKTDKVAWKIELGKVITENMDTNITISPALNIKEETYVTNGDGSREDPYIIKGNQKHLKAGEDINKAQVGDFITYSGYLWRVIGVEDGLTKVIMEDVINLDGDRYYSNFSEKLPITYNPTEEGNIGYNINNEISEYVSTKLFVSKKFKVNNYSDNIKYLEKAKQKEYKVKFIMPSIYELFSTDISEEYWYIDYSSAKKEYCYAYSGLVKCTDYNYDQVNNIRIEGYLKENTKVKTGEGSETTPYELVS